MVKHQNFKKEDITFDLSHLDGQIITIVRPATDKYSEKKYQVWVTFSDHCFTGHAAKNNDESWAYPLSEGRYFCPYRYEQSKNLHGLLKDIIQKNAHLLRTFNEHREQFYYLDVEYIDVNYSIFFEISKSNHKNSELRIKIISAHEKEDWSSPVKGSYRFKFWSLVDARINNKELAFKKRRR
jgi:hypothetical protein